MSKSQVSKTQIQILLIATFGLFSLGLGACNNSNQPTTTSSSPVVTPVAEGSPTNQKKETNSHGGQGGQVIESGPYHLELVTAPEKNGIHLDFFLQKGDNHEPIPNAQVTAQIQLPDGSQKTLPMKYDAAGKHYYGVLSGTMTGEYQVAILSDIQGEKVNARYRFKW